MSDLSLTYYSYVFDASGYGHAARAYIHALHDAGVRLAVVNLVNRPPQVEDDLVRQLIGRRIDADFHLFHGIPPQWARHAFRLPNAIGMTVWETDIMPTQWRPVLNHVRDVWLPCDFNIAVFRSALESQIFKLPHPIFPPRANGHTVDGNALLGSTPEDFVFYSVFEWQDRKSPLQLIEAFLRAFPSEQRVLLAVKTNPGAHAIAHQSLAELRALTRSQARVIIHAAGWSETQMEALHQRGDCYVSLHRGEGWNYPLFDAAARGQPVIATAYSGPLEYLTEADHCLVRYQLAEVRQPYLYYHPKMRWAEPDLVHAAELMRKVLAHPAAARTRASRGAERIRRQFAPDLIAAAARDRLLELKSRTRERSAARNGVTRERPRPPVPIPGSWYDRDYFESGIKSNWKDGYTWPGFAGLFRDTARFLADSFSDAQSFLDIGCAKGFLVRALREQGRECWGFDHSPWAIEHAEATARPFLQLGSTDDVRFERQFDVLLALEVLADLTEQQIDDFLQRARGWTRIALLATIPTVTAHSNGAEQDPAHITMRERDWWHARFLAAGWKQDPLHRVAERLCMLHPLPSGMGWQVYLYAP